METEANIAMNPDIIQKWQQKINLLHESLGVKAALIMKVHPLEIEVFVRSTNSENPFNVGDKGEINIGTYCDTVVGSGKQVEITDAKTNDFWKEKLPVNNGLECYLGAPILFPNQDLFGTICIMDQTARKFTGLEKKLFNHFQESIETDLVLEEQRVLIDKNVN